MFNSIRASIVSILSIISCLTFAQGTVPSPRATTDIICHTNRASECYPRTFQPTSKFELVHDDQELPPGLHIRMNLATGVKEARLNELEHGEDQHVTGLTIVDDYDDDDDDHEPRGSPGLRDQSKPSLFTLPPSRPPPFDPSEGSLFRSSIDVLKSSSDQNSETALSALSDLEDLAHSHHWGLTLARDRSISHILFNFLRPSNSQSASSVEVQIRSATALLLATAIHNNPAALTATLSHFYNDEWPTGPLELVLMALIHDQLPSLLTRMVFLLSALCQDETQLWQFVEAGGLDILAKVFDPDNAGSDEKDRLRGKIANFMLDHLFQIPERHCLFERPEHAGEGSGTDKQLGPSSDCEHEDSWVMIDKKIISSMQAQRTTDSVSQKGEASHPVADVFSPWCSLFGKSSQVLSNAAKDTEKATASENIYDAQRSLMKKMNLYGHDC